MWPGPFGKWPISGTGIRCLRIVSGTGLQSIVVSCSAGQIVPGIFACFHTPSDTHIVVPPLLTVLSLILGLGERRLFSLFIFPFSPDDM